MNDISDLARHSANVARLLADARNPTFEDDDPRAARSLAAYADAHLDDPEVTDDEITEWGAQLGLSKADLIVRLRKYIADSEVPA